MSTKGFLLVDTKDGVVAFPGDLYGAIPEGPPSKRKPDQGYGELVFNTSMTGYQEILTDPSYYGELVCMTYPHIGNTGTNKEDPESKKAWCSGLIVRDFCETPSNWRSTEDLDSFLKSWEIPAISGVDTRNLTRILRSSGVMRGIIVKAEELEQGKKWISEIPKFEGRDLISEVTTREPYIVKAQGSKKFNVVALDFGIKSNLLRSLANRGCEVTVLPANANLDTIQKVYPKLNGVFLSNGPGDPMAATYAHQTVKALVGKVPVFGVCMGHQILGISMGAKTYKLKFGHRGGNQPVQVVESGRVEISSHNHGYAVDDKTLPSKLRVTHVNLNDRCVEGMEVVPETGKAPAFSVQYHPEACPGPHDSVALFDRFISNMEAFH